MSWMVACLQPNCERKAVFNLQRQGFEVYSPKCRPVKSKGVQPLFPGYVFVKLENVWRSITGTIGVSKLIMAEAEKPGTIDDSVIQEIKAREGGDGLVDLPHAPSFSEGQRVKIASGPFEGRTALYAGQSGQDRCFVLLSFIGRQVRVRARDEDLVAA